MRDESTTRHQHHRHCGIKTYHVPSIPRQTTLFEVTVYNKHRCVGECIAVTSVKKPVAQGRRSVIMSCTLHRGYARVSGMGLNRIFELSRVGRVPLAIRHRPNFEGRTMSENGCNRVNDASRRSNFRAYLRSSYTSPA